MNEFDSGRLRLLPSDPVVKKSDAYTASVHPEINQGMPRYSSEHIVALRASVQRHGVLQRELATLDNAIESANLLGDFESGVELVARMQEKDYERAVIEQRIWELLRKEFGE
jgi:hypothetical protein